MKKLIVLLVCFGASAWAQQAIGNLQSGGDASQCTGCTISTAVSGTLSSNVLAALPNITDASVGAKCDGTSDDSAAINSVFTTPAIQGIKAPSGKTCLVNSYLAVPAAVQALDLDFNNATLTFSGTGGGACSQGTNGLFRIGPNGNLVTIRNVTINVTNASAGCIVNFSQTGAGDNFAHALILDHVHFVGTGSTTNLVGIYTTNSGETVSFRDSTFINLKQEIYSDQELNTASITGNNFEQQSGATPTNYHLYVNGDPQAAYVGSNNFEINGAYSATSSNNGVLSFWNNWQGDGCPTTGNSFGSPVFSGMGNFIYSVSCTGGNTQTGVLLTGGVFNWQSNSINFPNGVQQTGGTGGILFNAISSGSGDGIQATANAVIVGNQVSGSSGEGIVLSGAHNVLLANGFFGETHNIDCGGVGPQFIQTQNATDAFNCPLSVNLLTDSAWKLGAIVTANAASVTASTPDFLLGSLSTTGALFHVLNGGSSYLSMYGGFQNSAIWASSIPGSLPSGYSVLSGSYYQGVGILGTTGTNSVFNVQVSGGSGSFGLGNSLFTVTGSKVVTTFANTLDDGSGNVIIPSIKSTTGTRYVCVDTTGKLVSSATACVGT